MIDWNGDGKIDPIDIGVTIAVRSISIFVFCSSICLVSTLFCAVSEEALFSFFPN